MQDMSEYITKYEPENEENQ